MFFALIIGAYLAFYLTHPFIVLLHELGHAWAYILLTNTDRVDVFVGSYGDKNTQLKFKVGRLYFFIKLKFPFVSGGMCRAHHATTTYHRHIIILLAGSVVTFVVSILIGAIVLSSEIHGSAKLFCFALMIYSFIGLFVNLKPATIRRTNLDNDGKLIALAISIRPFFDDYMSLQNDIEEKNYAVAAKKLRNIVNTIPDNVTLKRTLIGVLLQLKEFNEAERYLTDLNASNEPNVTDHINEGYIYSLTGRRNQAIFCYLKALAIDDKQIVGLNNLGYELTLQGNYDEARKYLEKAIGIDPEFAPVYGSFGLHQVLTGDLENGKILLDKSIALDAENAFTYKHLGIYYLKTNDREAALLNFNKALALDSTIDLETYAKDAELLPNTTNIDCKSIILLFLLTSSEQEHDREIFKRRPRSKMRREGLQPLS